MDKAEYFPRKKLFEEAQDLVATFYSTGDYISENASEYASMLTKEDEKDEFYYCLYLLSMLSSTNELLKVVEHIVKSLNSSRVRRKVTSIEEFQGEIDIEAYIARNYVEKVSPKEYPSVIKCSTFQMPEYQLTLYIIRRVEEIYHSIFKILGDNKKVTAFKMAHRYCDRIKKNGLLLRRKYGVDYKRNETYLSLKKKVIYRYRNRKILNKDFKFLIKLFEKMIQLRGIDLSSSEALDVLEHYPEFDDRLYEIWLIRKSTEMLARSMEAATGMVTYNPLFKARKNNESVVALTGNGYRIEILFQNRKKLMPKKDLKWFYWMDDGKQDEIGAIPDLIFIRYADGSDDPEQIVLVDAKNRTWTFNHMEPIKNEIVQQIYIHDNFITLFKDRFCSMLVAHNIEALQTRKYYHKDKSGYEIDVISMNMKNERELNNSLEKYMEDLKNYLDIQ